MMRNIKQGYFKTYLMVVLSVLSCSKSNQGEISKETDTPPLTIGADRITAVSAVLSGKAYIGSAVSSDLSVGVMVSTSAGVLPSNSVKIEALDLDKDYRFSVLSVGLKPGTTYYYRSYVSQNGKDSFGETKEFKTKSQDDFVRTLEAGPINASTATLNALIDIDNVPGQVSFGFYYGKNENSLASSVKGALNDKRCSASITGLSHNTTYYFKAFVKIDDTFYYGNVSSFSTGCVSVESVVLDQHSVTIYSIGQTVTLKATVSPNEATDKSVSWSSDNQKVASVDDYGRVTANDNGSANITVVSRDSNKKDVCRVDVRQNIQSISFSNSSIDLYVGDVVTIGYTILPGNAYDKSLSWSSSDIKIATVSSSGKVSAVSPGTVVIKATANDNSNQSASCTVTVKNHVTSITLDFSSITLYTGKTQQLKATVLPNSADGQSLTWTSSNTNVATVSSTGLVEGIREGSATITASANDGSGVKANCKVSVVQSVSEIVFSNETLSLVEGDVISMNFSILPSYAYNKTVIWSSSNPSIATVNSMGVITALKKGKVSITAVAQDGSGSYASCFVIVSRKCPSNAIDLGLTNEDGYKIYWAKCNLGATSPEQIGEFYSWGETETKSIFRTTNYQWYQNNKYVLPGGLNDISRSSYDVAYVKLGSEWHIPKPYDRNELDKRCSWVETTSNGIKGLKATGPNGQTIFFPYTGKKEYYSGEDSYNNKDSGFYWCSYVSYAGQEVGCMQIHKRVRTDGLIPGAHSQSLSAYKGICVRAVYD